ncbi:hypothetical protein NP493_128g03024 [Ridgeia piscesae]|uniref:Multidrug and toxin extrusion protein n=1 Tax=Ridgeia piscesae TaxID=27915 RepID=A0AAD9UGH0_RIDPI|nr:hypothetical protein NP493_128g03024 [Ridgeia piscesae]
MAPGAMEDRSDNMDEVTTSRRGCFPYGFRRESRALFRLAWPTSLSILFHYMIQPISIAFCGHLGTEQLAGVAMAMSIIYITCVSIGRGLAFGADTFFSQTYGSTNKKKVGVYLQRGIIFGMFACCPIWAVLLNVESILLLLGQDPGVVALAQEYILFFLPGVLAYCWLFILMRYLLCQNRVLPNLAVCVVSCAINAVLHYGLVVQAQMGIRGSAIALAITYYLVLAQLLAYIWGSGVYVETWDGWKWENLKEWGQFARVTCASIGMTFIFWLCTEAGTFLSGILGKKELSAYSITFQVEGFVWMIPLGLGGACTARVGQFLGANQPVAALTSCRVTVTIQMALSAGMAVTAYVLRTYIPMAFSTDSELVSYTAGLLQVVAVFVLLEGIGGVGVGIVRGTGRQTLGAVIIFVSYYAVALPVGISLMFATSLGLYGLWWGYVLGLALQDVCLLVFMARLDWDKEAEKVRITKAQMSLCSECGSLHHTTALSFDLTKESPFQRNTHSILI